MCGRFALGQNGSQLVQAARDEELSDVEGVDDEEWPGSRYNVAPQTRVPVLHRSSSGSSSGSGSASDKVALRFEMQTWGLVPHWTKRPPDSATRLKTINARDDTILSGSGMWQSIKGRKRGIVFAEGFYEWLKKGADRIPHFVKRKDGHPLALAALWDSVTYEGEADEHRTFTIVTTASNKQLSFLHDRMPVILHDVQAMRTWLDTSSQTWTPELAKLLIPYPIENGLACYPVAKEVGKVGNNSSDFVVPVSERKGNLASFFAKQAASSPKKPAPSPSPNDQPVPSSTKGKAKAAPVPSSKPSPKRKRANDDDDRSKPSKKQVIDIDADEEHTPTEAKKEEMAETGKLDAFVVRQPA